MGGPERSWAKELARRTPRLFLHAAELGFEHPVSGAAMRFQAPLPPDLAAVAEWARDLFPA
jgi:23S rRNA pseudouridine1911/1915/1917 synthase